MRGPSFAAVVASALTSEPASGSESAKAAMWRPAHTGGRYLALIRRCRKAKSRRCPAPAWRRRNRPGCRARRKSRARRKCVRTSSFSDKAAIGRRHHRLEPAGVAQRAHQRAAGLIDVSVIDVAADFLAGPIRQAGANRRCCSSKNGQARCASGASVPTRVHERSHGRAA